MASFQVNLQNFDIKSLKNVYMNAGDEVEVTFTFRWRADETGDISKIMGFAKEGNPIYLTLDEGVRSKELCSDSCFMGRMNK